MSGWLAVLAALAAPAQALPMGSDGTWMLMADAAPDARMVAANLAISRNSAPGAVLRAWDEELHTGPALKRRSAGASWTQLLKRWNLPDAQANLWLVLDAGTARQQGAAGQAARNGAYAAAAFVADFETTRLYLGGSLRPLRGEQGLRGDETKLRAGFAFWEPDYESTQPWLIVEAKRERGAELAERTLVTPLLRLIHRSYFIEAGANRKGGVVNLMFNF